MVDAESDHIPRHAFHDTAANSSRQRTRILILPRVCPHGYRAFSPTFGQRHARASRRSFSLLASVSVSPATGAPLACGPAALTVSC
jgi:hypothetical protein